MKAFQALLLVGGILLAIGVYFLIPAFPLTDNRTISLDPGQSLYYYLSFNVFKDGQLSGQFSESQGQAVNVYIFDQGEYDSFRTQGGLQSIFSSTASSSGTFSATIPQPGSYYLVFTHGAGLENSSQQVTVNVSLGGYNLVVLGTGLGLLVTGSAMFALGYRGKKKHQASLPAPTASDVTLFDKPQPPAPLVRLTS